MFTADSRGMRSRRGIVSFRPVEGRFELENFFDKEFKILL